MHNSHIYLHSPVISQPISPIPNFSPLIRMENSPTNSHVSPIPLPFYPINNFPIISRTFNFQQNSPIRNQSLFLQITQVNSIQSSYKKSHHSITKRKQSTNPRKNLKLMKRKFISFTLIQTSILQRKCFILDYND